MLEFVIDRILILKDLDWIGLERNSNLIIMKYIYLSEPETRARVNPSHIHASRSKLSSKAIFSLNGPTYIVQYIDTSTLKRISHIKDWIVVY